jgi:hypothetical protein
MTGLVSLLADIDFNGQFGLWMFLSIGAVALFAVFIPLVAYFGNRRQEREAFYRAETIRRIAEAPGEGAKAALELFREQERQKALKALEAMKVGGLVNLGGGIALLIFLRFLLGGGPGSPYLCGLIPAFVGVALLTYALFLAPQPER